MDDGGRRLKAGEYFYEDLSVGDYFPTGAIVVTDAHIVGFAGLSGDFFDLHVDDDFARAQGFPGRVAHGLLGLALVDGLKNRSPVRIMAVASLGWNWRFHGPILVNDRISANVRVTGLRRSSKGQPLATLMFDVTKQDGSIVQSGETTLLIRFRNNSSQ